MANVQATLASCRPEVTAVVDAIRWQMEVRRNALLGTTPAQPSE